MKLERFPSGDLFFCVLFRISGLGYFCSMGAHAERLSQNNNRSSWWSKKNRLADRFPLDITIEGDTGITQQFERQQDAKAVTAFNGRIRAWGKKVNEALQASVSKWIDEDKKLSASIRQNYRHWGKVPAKGEEITSIGFGFNTDGLYVHLGVGRGYNMEGGTRVITKKSNKDWNREPKPWFNPVIEQHIPELQQIVVDYCGSLFINTTRIYINR